MDKLKIGIVGGGRIGRFLGVMLTANHYDVQLVCNRFKGVHIGNTCEFDIEGDFGSKNTLVNVIDDISKLPDNLDIIFMTTRSDETVKYASMCKEKIKNDGCVVTIHNVFCIDKIAKSIPPQNSICAYLDINCNYVNDNIIYATDFNGITLGIYDKSAFNNLEKVKSVLSSFCDVHVSKDIVGFVLGRNIINGAISMLGAISGMKLGDILLDRNGIYLFTKIITEAVNAIKRFRINIIPYNDQLDYYKFIEDRWYRRKIIRILRKNNKYVRSSALKDIENGRKTELSFVLGLIFDYGKKFKMDIKYITAIYEMVKEIEEGKRAVSNNAFYDKKLVNLEKEGKKNDNWWN